MESSLKPMWTEETLPNAILLLQLKSSTLFYEDKEKAEILRNTFIIREVSIALEDFPFGPTNCRTTFKLEENICCRHEKNSTIMAQEKLDC